VEVDAKGKDGEQAAEEIYAALQRRATATLGTTIDWSNAN
jgi:hypothetical protein